MKKETIKCLDSFYQKKVDLNYLKESIEAAISLLVDCATSSKTILVCGNGGSAADSQHIAGELLKSFRLKRPLGSFRQVLENKYGKERGDYLASNLQEGIKCIPLTSFDSFNTAFANDCKEKMAFAQLVSVLGSNNDILIAISTSGNSENVVAAAEVAKAKGMKVIGLTGYNGGKLREYSDVLLNAPSDIVYEIQEKHIELYHLLCLALENELFDK